MIHNNLPKILDTLISQINVLEAGGHPREVVIIEGPPAQTEFDEFMKFYEIGRNRYVWKGFVVSYARVPSGDWYFSALYLEGRLDPLKELERITKRSVELEKQRKVLAAVSEYIKTSNV